MSQSSRVTFLTILQTRLDERVAIKEQSSMDKEVLTKEIDTAGLEDFDTKGKGCRCWIVLPAVIFVVACLGVGGFLAYWFTRTVHEEEYTPSEDRNSLGGPYERAAVASDAGPCSEIGANILELNGSAVDSAIATMFCVGVINMHSTGIGGGGFMLVYNRTGHKAEVFDFRDTAPGLAKKDMFVNSSYKLLNSSLSTGVPGEVRGYYAAWKWYGRLPWERLIQPAIDKAKHGFLINKAVYSAMKQSNTSILSDPGLRELLVDAKGNLKREGDNVTNPQLAVSLEKIRDDPESFYTGSLANDIVRDIKRRGGIITQQDLNDFKVVRKKALINLMGNMTWYTVPPPASGPVITMILNILKGYNMTSEARADPSKSSLTYHRIVEAFKFGFAWRSRLGDPAFNNDTKQIVQKMTNETFADFLREKIWDNKTHSNASYYGNVGFSYDDGTSHLSVLSPDGDAVAVTSSINYFFGCKYRSTITGIIYNNEMADFSTPGQSNPDGIEPSKSNFVKPGKRAQSSISPVIFTDKSGRVRLVAGASGGPHITTATSLTVMNELWFARGISKAVDDPRVHHQLFPNTVVIEMEPYTIPKSIQLGLRSRGHNITVDSAFAAVQAIVQNDNRQIYGKCDPRKHGWPAGF